MKKYLLLLSAIILFSFSACLKSASETNVDAQAQLDKDDVLIKAFLVTNNISAIQRSFWGLLSGNHTRKRKFNLYSKHTSEC